MTDADGIDLRGYRLLVVEDEYMLASDMGDLFAAAGAEVLGPCPTVAAALGLLASVPLPHGALLDVKLRGLMIWPLVDVLLDRDVPVLLVTGYDSGAIPRVYAGLPRCRKPIGPGPLARAMVRRMAGPGMAEAAGR